MASRADEVERTLAELLQEEARVRTQLRILRARIRATETLLDAAHLEEARKRSSMPEDGPELPVPPRSKRSRPSSLTPEGVCAACWRREKGLRGGPAHRRDATCRKREVREGGDCDSE